MAGLLTARVLADTFTRVTLFERDELPDGPEFRKGVPQARHAHALLNSGRLVLEEFFPGITAELNAQGAPLGSGRFFTGGGYLKRPALVTNALFVSRPCLEHEVRRRVIRLPNVEILTGYDVCGLTAGEGGARVSGIEARCGSTQSSETFPAALVVDASGRGSRTGTWLEALGYSAPEVELVEVAMGYSSRFFRRGPDDLGGNLIVNVAPSPAVPRAGAAIAQEGQRWLVTLAGYFGDHPPTDDQGFLDYARTLPAPEIYEVARNAEPLSAPVAYRFQANQRRRYEKLDRFPAGFLVIGDALCSFTPIYGQGMSVAALETRALRACLADGFDNLAARFFRQASKIIDIAWTITVGNDQRLSNHPAARKFPARFINWYLARLQTAAHHDPELSLAFTQVGNLSAAPPSLLRPGLAIRVLRGNLRQPRVEPRLHERHRPEQEQSRTA